MNTIADILPWQIEQWQTCQQYLALNRVPQALLIKGHAGLGKMHFARQFTAALLCEDRQDKNQACGECHGCLLLKADTHPDFMLIQPEEEGKNIGIDIIRGLLPKLALKPQYQAYRVVVFQSAEQMNTASSNAFLKCLEEPNERTVIVLVTAMPERLPATIRSRCQQLVFNKPTAKIALAWLQQQNIAQDHLRLLSLAQGAPMQALEYAQTDVLALRDRCFDEWCQIAKRRKSPIAIAEHWQKLPTPTLLHWLASWVTDLIKCFYSNENNFIYNSDLLPVLRDMHKRLNLKQLFKYYELLLVSQKNAHTTLNKQLMFEAILIHWSDLNCTE